MPMKSVQFSSRIEEFSTIPLEEVAPSCRASEEWVWFGTIVQSHTIDMWRPLRTPLCPIRAVHGVAL